ncbi:cation transporter [Corynebacterium bovis]|uniref:heavy-metal-associated domain-containing protein n=1 Tax=Corynebacterium bovis TaxID=36808 RepID=UPI0031388406
MSTRTYTVTGMSCGHCENAVREEVGALDGVSGITVSAETGTLTLDARDTVTDDTVIAAVDEAGYTATRAE